MLQPPEGSKSTIMAESTPSEQEQEGKSEGDCFSISKRSLSKHRYTYLSVQDIFWDPGMVALIQIDQSTQLLI